MVIGIDIGTSAVKVVLLNNEGKIVASETQKISIAHPKPLWSEQNPLEWWQAVNYAVKKILKTQACYSIQAIGLSGQMHGAVILDKNNNVIRPAILWNDNRSSQECIELEQACPNIRNITGNIIMPGFTAPKLLWLKKHEPENFKRIHKILLPKDYIRLCLTNDYATDVSDASGTMWFEVSKRDWSDQALKACCLNKTHMPKVYESDEVTGYLKSTVQKDWNIKNDRTAVVAGGGDNAAGAVGVGMVKPGQGILSLGTSGVYFLVTNKYCQNYQNAVHSFCHAVKGRWHLMSVMLSAASCLEWASKVLKYPSVSDLVMDAESSQKHKKGTLIFLPYLNGERTPHNNPYAKGMFFGLNSQHLREDMALAVMEGVGFGISQGMKVVHSSGEDAQHIVLLGGGAKSTFWCQMLSDITGKKLFYYSGSEVGPALGAARLALVASSDNILKQQLFIEKSYTPNNKSHIYYLEMQKKFEQIYEYSKKMMDQNF